MKKNQVLYAILLVVMLAGCAATDETYSGRNDLDTARARCVDLARDSGYRDVTVNSVDRDGRAEWKVGLAMTKDGKDHKERCEYSARTNRVHMDD